MYCLFWMVLFKICKLMAFELIYCLMERYKFYTSYGYLFHINSTFQQRLTKEEAKHQSIQQLNRLRNRTRSNLKATVKQDKHWWIILFSFWFENIWDYFYFFFTIITNQKRKEGQRWRNKDFFCKRYGSFIFFFVFAFLNFS